MQLRSFRLFSVVALAVIFGCAAALQGNRTDKKPRIEVTITPGGPVVCDEGVPDVEGNHYRKITVVLSQHNRKLEYTFIVDNKKYGYRFEPHQKVTLDLNAGLGGHVIQYGTYILDENKKIKITWQGQRKIWVSCCHGKRTDKIRVAGGL